MDFSYFSPEGNALQSTEVGHQGPWKLLMGGDPHAGGNRLKYQEVTAQLIYNKRASSNSGTWERRSSSPEPITKCNSSGTVEERQAGRAQQVQWRRKRLGMQWCWNLNRFTTKAPPPNCISAVSSGHQILRSDWRQNCFKSKYFVGIWIH